MSRQGDLRGIGIDPLSDGSLLITQPVVFGAGLSSGIGLGKMFFVDPANGSDNRNGRSPSQAFATLSHAHDMCTAGKNDTVVLIGDGTTAATARLTETLTWSKDATHLIGLTAPVYWGHRARISHETTETTNFKMMVVSADGCIFRNFSFFQGVGEAATAEQLIEITGLRNRFESIHFGGMGHANGAGVATSYVIKITGGEENVFSNCVIGLDTIQRTAANASVLFASGALRTVFENCIFSAAFASVTTGLFIDANSSGAFGGGLGALCKRCTFYAEANIGSATTPAVAAVVHASANGTLLLDGCGFENVTKIAAASARVRSVNMPSQAADQGVATNAST